MILDNQAILSDKQAIVATANSTNVIDLQPAGKTYNNIQLIRNVGKMPIPFLVSVNEAFNNLTSLTVIIQGSVDEAFTTPKNIVSFTMPLADLKVGAKIPYDILPTGIKGLRYLRTRYEVVGTAPSTGKVTAGVVGAVDEGYYGNV